MDNLRIRILKDKIFSFLVVILAFLACLPLFLILGFIIRNGALSINLDFFIHLPKPVGVEGGGISNAIVGTFIIVFIAFIIATPFAIFAGIYLSENRKNLLAEIMRVSVDILASIPSIVIGIIAYLWIVKPMKSFSALSAGVALAIIMLPVVIKSTEETLAMIPYSLKEASFALGVPYYRTILKVIFPAGLSGVITGILIAISRIAGETAPLLFTAFGNPFMNLNITKPMNTITLVVFNYSTSPYEQWHKIAWAASLVLLIIVLGFNLLSRIISRKWKVKF
ncbi:MAG: phosphate ABC transporter permease PstA [Candidatus Omnitrophica bacterium]|nr:phosphate ABC transporter permease PstA [Candidatus Omnitrophota bacterium]MCM8817751.1 phosphate ABC transporter permease PstA [Candidatus Omnitrophota bacterium]